MQLGEQARVVLRLGCVVLVAAALASVWELLASQVPGSRFSIGMLPGPIQLLREATATFGCVLLIGALLVGTQPLPAALLWVLRVGVGLLLATGVYAAATGMHGVQAFDLRPDAVWLFAFKYLGRALLYAGLFEIGRRVVQRT
jgi:hypothetical protein